jgi:hypothetical protein
MTHVMPIQAVTIVTKGGTMMQLCDQRGAPQPTTGKGALVWNTGAHLIDCILEGSLSNLNSVQVMGGDFYDPSIQFTLEDSKTSGFYSTGPGNISLVGTSGDESSRTLLASFDHPGNLTVPQFATAGGTIPTASNDTTLATTSWVKSAIISGGGSFTQGSILFAGPTGGPVQDNANLFWDDTNNRLGIGTAAPAVALDVRGAATFTGALTGTTATMSGSITSTGGTIQASGGPFQVNRVGDAAAAQMFIDADAGQVGEVNFRTGAVSRWAIRKNATAEGGSNAGSDFEIQPRTDAGAALPVAIAITRSTGAVTLSGGLTGAMVGYATAVPFQTYAGSTQTPLAQVASAGQAALSVQRYVGGGINTGPIINLSKSQGAAAGTQAIVINGDIMGNLSFNGSDGVKFVEGAYIRAEVDGAPGLNDMPGRLIFATSVDGAAAPTEAMRIASDNLVTLTGALTAEGNISTTGGALFVDRIGDAANAFSYIRADTGFLSEFQYTTGSSARWGIRKTATAESGSNAGSNLQFVNYDDSGVSLGAPFQITRSTGAVTLSGALTGATATMSGTITSTNGSIVTQGGNVQVNRVGDAAAGQIFIDVDAGFAGQLQYRTGAVDRWIIRKNSTAEGGANAGSDLEFSPRDDAGAALPSAFVIARSTGSISTAAQIRLMSGTAIPAGGTAGAGYLLSSTANFGTIFGSGAPTASMARGSLYLRSDGGGPYVNTDGATAWSTIGGGGASVTVSATAPGSPADGALWYNSDGSAGGGTMYIRYNDGNTTQWVPTSPAATPGSLLQTVFVETGAVATGTTLIPFDDTIPQITEGDQYMTCAITPKSATSKLVITVNAALSNSAIVAMCGALFQDSVANALAATYAAQATTNYYQGLTFTHTMTSGTTSLITFRFRAGGSTAGTTTFNGNAGTRVFGGVMASSIVIQEVA